MLRLLRKVKLNISDHGNNLEHPHRVHTGVYGPIKPLRSEETMLIHALFGIQAST